MINIVKTEEGSFKVFEDGTLCFIMNNAVWRSYGGDTIQLHYINKVLLLEVVYTNLQVNGVTASSLEDAGDKLTAIGLGFSTASGGSGANNIIVVDNYSSLPDPTTEVNKFFFAENSQGTRWLPGSLGGNYYPSGLYYSNGVNWVYSPHPYESTQSEVNTGVNNDTFVTPLTLNNYSRWNNKANLDSTTSRLQINEAPLTWDFLAEHWSVEPTFNTTITGGEVYNYTYLGVTRYRFIPSPYDSTNDSFYQNFDGSNLTILINNRG